MRRYYQERTLKKLLKTRTNPLPHMDLKNKLEIFAVKVGIKPAFQGHVDQSSPDLEDNIDVLKQVATIVGLHCKLTSLPPQYYRRKPKVKDSFLNAWNNITFAGKSIWLYHDTHVESVISKSIEGKLNEGYVLGYPKCCIEWHEHKRVCVVEARFQDTKKYIMTNPLAFHDFQVETEEQMYGALLCSPMHLERQKAVFESINEHILETWSHYPFVPHWACAHCLNGKSKETTRLNNRYKDVAMKLSPKFAQDIIHHLHKFTE